MIRRSSVAVLLVALLPWSAAAQYGPVSALVAGQVADYVSTEIALQRGGVREANPLMQSPAARAALKAGSTALGVWAVRRIAPRHPKVAAVFGYTVGAAMGALAVSNLRQVAR